MLSAVFSSALLLTLITTFTIPMCGSSKASRGVYNRVTIIFHVLAIFSITVRCIRPRLDYRTVNCTADAVAQCESNESHFNTSRVGKITFILVSAKCFRNRSLIRCLESDVKYIVSCSSSDGEDQVEGEVGTEDSHELELDKCLEGVTNTALSTICSKRSNERQCVSIAMTSPS